MDHHQSKHVKGSSRLFVRKTKASKAKRIGAMYSGRRPLTVCGPDDVYWDQEVQGLTDICKIHDTSEWIMMILIEIFENDFWYIFDDTLIRMKRSSWQEVSNTTGCLPRCSHLRYTWKLRKRGKVLPKLMVLQGHYWPSQLWMISENCAHWLVPFNFQKLPCTYKLVRSCEFHIMKPSATSWESLSANQK